MAGIVPIPPAVAAAEGVESHPLLNPVVLKRLFEVIPFELQEFRNIRLVSRTWSNLSLSKWRQNAWLNLIESDEGSPKISLRKYLGLIENDEHQLIQHPFRKYFMTMWNINIQEEQVPLQFWNRVGPLMRHLIVEKSKFFSAADVRAVVFEKTPNLERLSVLMNIYQSRTKRPDKRKKRLDPNLPHHTVIPTGRVQKNLKEFDIDLIIRGEDGEEDGIMPNVAAIQINLPFTWMELLLHFPNIKKLGPLQLSFRVNAEVELLEFFESVEVLRKNYGPCYLADLQDLDLTQLAEVEARAFSGVFVSCLNRLQFPLKRLALTLGYSVDEKVFKKLLQGCVNTLEYLSVVREGLPFQNFPFGLKFIALKELTLVGPFTPNLMFLKECPNLEVFRLTPFIAGRLEANLTQLVEKSEGNPPKLEKLKELWITNDGCSAEEVRQLGQLMPNLRRLGMGLDNKSFRAMCGVWKELEHLTIVPWRVEENALLGKDEETGENFRHPNLTELKNLKSFKMENIKLLSHRQELTNAAILEGILALPNLEVVNLCISSKVSREVRNQLARRFPKYFIFNLEGVRGGI